MIFLKYHVSSYSNSSHRENFLKYEVQSKNLKHIIMGGGGAGTPFGPQKKYGGGLVIFILFIRKV